MSSIPEWISFFCNVWSDFSRQLKRREDRQICQQNRRKVSTLLPASGLMFRFSCCITFPSLCDYSSHDSYQSYLTNGKVQAISSSARDWMSLPGLVWSLADRKRRRRKLAINNFTVFRKTPQQSRNVADSWQAGSVSFLALESKTCKKLWEMQVLTCISCR